METRHDIHSIVRFEFGEHYLVWYVGDKYEEYTDLEKLLKYMEFVFSVGRRGHRPMVRLLRRIDGSIRHPSEKSHNIIRVLAVEPTPSGANYPLHAEWIDDVRNAVTVFSLTGTWDHIEKNIEESIL